MKGGGVAELKGPKGGEDEKKGAAIFAAPPPKLTSNIERIQLRPLWKTPRRCVPVAAEREQASRTNQGITAEERDFVGKHK